MGNVSHELGSGVWWLRGHLTVLLFWAELHLHKEMLYLKRSPLTIYCGLFFGMRGSRIQRYGHSLTQILLSKLETHSPGSNMGNGHH